MLGSGSGAATRLASQEGGDNSNVTAKLIAKSSKTSNAPATDTTLAIATSTLGTQPAPVQYALQSAKPRHHGRAVPILALLYAPLASGQAGGCSRLHQTSLLWTDQGAISGSSQAPVQWPKKRHYSHRVILPKEEASCRHAFFFTRN